MPLDEFAADQANIEIAKAFQKSDFLSDFEENIGLYEGNPLNPAYDPSREFKTHTVFPLVDSNVSILYAQNPKITVTPTKMREVIKNRDGSMTEVRGDRVALLLEDLIHYTFKELHSKLEFQDAIRDTELGGYGFVELGWNAQIGKVAVPKEITGTGEKGEISVEYKEYLKRSMPFCIRRDPRQLLLPPFADGFRRLPWAVIEEMVPVDEVVTEESFEPAAKKELKLWASQGRGQFIHGRDGKRLYGAVDMRKVGKDPNFQMVRLYHFWDLKSGKYKVIADGIGQYMKNRGWPFKKMEGLPIEVLWYFPSYSSLYPVRPVDIYKTKAIEKERLRVRMLDAIDKSVAKILRQGSEDKNEIQRFTDAPQGGVVPVKKVEAYKELIVSHMPPEWVAFYQMIESDVMVEGQTTETKIGQQAAGGVKATELIQREQGFQIKKIRKQDMVQNWIERIVRKLIQLYQENLTVPISLRISPEHGGIDFRSISRIDIQGEYNFEVDIESAGPSTPARQIATARTLLEMGAVDPLIDRAKLWKRMLRPLKIAPEEVMRQPRNIDVVKLAEMEWQQMMQGQDVPVLDGEEHDAHIDEHMAKMVELQEAQRQGRIDEQVTVAAAKLVRHTNEHQNKLMPTGQLQPGQSKRRAPQGGRTEQSERSTVSTPVGQALSQTTEAARSMAEETPA